MCDISFITVNYNGLQDTLEFVASIREKVHSVTYEIIIVDNGSKGNDAEQLRKHCPDLTIVSSTENLGFAGGNNLALPHIHGSYLCFINNDTMIQTDAFDQLLRRFKDSPTIGMISPKIRYWSEPDVIQYAGFTPLSPVTLRNEGIGNGQVDKGQYNEPCPTAFPHGAAMLIPNKVLTEVGPMREDYFLYYEELDWAERIRRKGYEIWYDPSCVILHKESRSTGEGSPLKTYYLTRNRLFFARCNLRGVTRALSIFYQTAVALARNIVKPKEHSRAIRQGLYDYYKGNFGRMSVK